MECISIEKDSLKNDFDAHVCHVSIASSSIDNHFARSTSSSIENYIHILKKNVDCLHSTLSQCDIDHKRLEYMFHKKHASHMHVHQSWHIHASHVYTHNSLYARVTLVHIVVARDTSQNFVMIRLII